jgi:hypothetical protein
MTRQVTGEPNYRIKEIDWNIFESLCKIWCTQKEICAALNISDKTLLIKVREHYGEEYSDIYERFSEEGKISLRRSQIKLAQKNAYVNTWLCKQMLGQRDPEKTNELAALSLAAKILAENDNTSRDLVKTDESK